MLDGYRDSEAAGRLERELFFAGGDNPRGRALAALDAAVARYNNGGGLYGLERACEQIAGNIYPPAAVVKVYLEGYGNVPAGANWARRLFMLVDGYGAPIELDKAARKAFGHALRRNPGRGPGRYSCDPLYSREALEAALVRALPGCTPEEARAAGMLDGPRLRGLFVDGFTY